MKINRRPRYSSPRSPAESTILRDHRRYSRIPPEVIKTLVIVCSPIQTKKHRTDRVSRRVDDVSGDTASHVPFADRYRDVNLQLGTPLGISIAPRRSNVESARLPTMRSLESRVEKREQSFRRVGYVLGQYIKNNGLCRKTSRLASTGAPRYLRTRRYLVSALNYRLFQGKYRACDES